MIRSTCLLLALAAALLPAMEVTTDGDRFRFDGQLVDVYGIRCASAIGTDAYTDHLIAQLDDYRAHGVNAVTVFYMGSSGGHYDPFTSDGKGWRSTAFRDRMDRIIEACDQRGMMVIAGIFYQWKTEALTDRSLSGWTASKEAVRTVADHLEAKGYRNVLLNIANEQNSGGYSGEPWERVQNVSDLLEMVRIAKSAHPGLVVGCGGYDHGKNEQFGLASEVDVLFFDTLGPDSQQHSGHYHDRFKSAGVTGKPLVNVEIFGGWTKQFTPQGVYSSSGKDEHYSEISDAAARPGLSVFFHSNPWCQGPSIGAPVRFDLAGQGTASDPGIHWWFDRVQATVGGSGGNQAPSVRFDQPADGASLTAPADLGVVVTASDADGSVAQVELFIDGSLVRRENSAPYEWGTANAGNHDGALLDLPAGSYLLEAIATDDRGATTTAVITLEVLAAGANRPPTASASATPDSGTSPLRVTFDASASSDDDGTIASWAWDFGDGSTGSGQVVSHTFTSPDDGSFGVVLTVTDDDGASDRLTIPITIRAARADGIYEAEDALLVGPRVASGHTGYTGSGFADYQAASGERIVWTIDVASAGEHELAFRYALGSGDRPLRILVDGAVVAGSLSFPATGSWDAWGTVAVATFLDAGQHQVIAETIGSSGGNLDHLAVGAASTGAIAINMQPAAAPVPEGWLVDSGAAFGERGDGLSYGWDTTVAETRDRNDPAASDQVHDTLNHLQKGGADHRWELAVPAGFYQVTLVAGDPSYTDSEYRLAVEGTLAIDAIPSDGQRWFETTVVVEVLDGRLSIGNASGAVNNKLMAVTVVPTTGGNG